MTEKLENIENGKEKRSFGGKVWAVIKKFVFLTLVGWAIVLLKFEKKQRVEALETLRENLEQADAKETLPAIFYERAKAYFGLFFDYVSKPVMLFLAVVILLIAWDQNTWRDYETPYMFLDEHFVEMSADDQKIFDDVKKTLAGNDKLTSEQKIRKARAAVLENRFSKLTMEQREGILIDANNYQIKRELVFPYYTANDMIPFWFWENRAYRQKYTVLAWQDTTKWIGNETTNKGSSDTIHKKMRKVLEEGVKFSPMDWNPMMPSSPENKIQKSIKWEGDYQADLLAGKAIAHVSSDNIHSFFLKTADDKDGYLRVVKGYLNQGDRIGKNVAKEKFSIIDNHYFSAVGKVVQLREVYYAIRFLYADMINDDAKVYLDDVLLAMDAIANMNPLWVDDGGFYDRLAVDKAQLGNMFSNMLAKIRSLAAAMKI